MLLARATILNNSGEHHVAFCGGVVVVGGRIAKMMRKIQNNL